MRGNRGCEPLVSRHGCVFHFDGVILLAAREGWRLLFFVACIIAIGVVTSPSSRMACVACG